MGAIFGFVALPAVTTFAILGVIIVYFAAVEITKLLFYKKFGVAGIKLNQKSLKTVGVVAK